MNSRYFHLIGVLLILTVLLTGTFASAENVWEHPVVYSAETEAAVAEKVAELAAACTASGAEGDFEIAVWMHNWLIDNAYYDETYTEYGADGVLLKGTGVCQSYTLAYGLLLDAMGIENMMVVSKDMDPSHSWNLVNMEGSWYHVDCTWDDPIGGPEQHTYFGLSDALMSRDHSWETADYPACTAGECNYYLRTGECAIVSDQEDLNAAIAEQLANGNTEIRLYNISTDGFSNFAGIEEWFGTEAWKYSFSGYSYVGSEYYTVLTLNDYDPSARSIEYISDADFEDELLLALTAKAGEIYIYDHSGGTFDADALYTKAAAIVSASAPVYGCSINGGYGYSADGKFIIITVTYIDASDLPDPFELTGTTSDVRLSVATESSSMSTADFDRAIWVFGNSECYNTNALLNSLNAATSILKKAGVAVIVGLDDYSNGINVQSLIDTYVGFSFGSSDGAHWSALRDFGYESRIYYPAVFIQDADGTLIYCSTGYVDEPLRLVATAVDGQLPVVYDNILLLPADLIAVEESAFEGSAAFQEVRFGGTAATTIGANAFKDCSALRLITIPDSVKSIDTSAFDGCTDLTICSSEQSFAHEYADEMGLNWTSAD